MLRNGVVKSASVLGAALLVPGLIAFAVLFLADHDHSVPGSAEVLQHSGSLDDQGCHFGPSGYHCHR